MPARQYADGDDDEEEDADDPYNYDNGETMSKLHQLLARTTQPGVF